MSGAGAVCLRRPGLKLRHWQALVDADHSLMDNLLAQVPWRQEHITLYGKTHALPRLTCWMADTGCRYGYSGIAQQPSPWLPSLLQLRSRLAQICGHDLNGLLLNLYRDGNDTMGWHADDEPELVTTASIASISLGAGRTLRFKPKPGSVLAGGCEPLNLELGHGDLLLMDPPTQQHWLHGLPPRRRVSGQRINLTYRQLVVSA